VGADPARVVAALVGERRKLHARGRAFAHQFQGTGEQDHVVEEDFLGVSDVFPHGRRDLVLGQESPHGVLQPAADGAAHFRERRCGKPELRQHMAIGPVDRREGVHKGAVEIKEQRGVAAHGGRGKWRRAARETRKT